MSQSVSSQEVTAGSAWRDATARQEERQRAYSPTARETLAAPAPAAAAAAGAVETAVGGA